MANEVEGRARFRELLESVQALDGLPLTSLTTAQRWLLLGVLLGAVGMVGPGMTVQLPPLALFDPTPSPAASGRKKVAGSKRKRKGA